MFCFFKISLPCEYLQKIFILLYIHTLLTTTMECDAFISVLLIVIFLVPVQIGTSDKNTELNINQMRWILNYRLLHP